MLRNISILIVEDEPFIALDLAMEVEGARGTVVGPARSVSEAIDLIKKSDVQGAVLDVHLIDGDVTPVATQLFSLSVPFLFHSGVGLNAVLKSQFPNADVFLKPTPPSHLIKALASLVRH